jgi:hypothetical protein
MRKPVPEGEPWVLVRDVLAEAGGVMPGPGLDEEAERRARGWRGVRRDWADRPCITWTAARELLGSLRAEQARVAAEHARLAAEEDARRMLVVGGGVVQVERPGEPLWVSPNFVSNPYHAPALTTPGD